MCNCKICHETSVQDAKQLTSECKTFSVMFFSTAIHQFTSLIHLSGTTYKAKTYKMETNCQLPAVSKNLMAKMIPNMTKKLHNTQNIQYNTYYEYKCDINKFSNAWGSVGNQDQAPTFETIQKLMTAEKRN
jgi:hypothetical protein